MSKRVEKREVQVSERRRFRLGPRSHRGLFGYLTGVQAGVGGLGALLAIGLLASGRSVVTLILALLVAAGSLSAAFWPVANLTVAEWVPRIALFAVGGVRGEHAWRSPAAGMGVLLDRDGADHPEALPPVLGDLEILAVKRPGGVVGMVYDRRANTLCAVLQVRLRAFGLLGDEDQDGRLEAFAVLQDELARSGSEVQRLVLLKRTVPRRTNELAEYVQAERKHPLESAPVRSMLEVIDAGADLAQEHELFVVVQLAGVPRRQRGARGGVAGAVARRVGMQRPRRGGRRVVEGELRRRAGVQAAEALDVVARRLADAEIAVESVDGALTPRALGRVIKDSFDPFGRVLRDRLDLIAPEGAGMPPEHAWPDSTDHYLDRYRCDSADHVTWHIKEWPRVPVTAGFLAPLTLGCEVPVMTIAVVMEPIPAVRAMRDASKRRVSDRVSAETRRKAQQITTSEQVDREEQSDRGEREVTSGYSSWRYEAYVSASVPVGDEDALDDAVDQVESACTRSHLLPRRMYGQQERAFTYTLPLARGLR